MVDKHKHTNDDPELVPESQEERSDIELEEIEEREAGKLKSLKADLKASEKEKMQLLEDLQRAKADFLNSRRRLEEQLSRDRERATDRMLLDLLPVLDSFEQAMEDRETWETCDEKWRKGMEAIYTQLEGILRNYGAHAIGKKGEPFDPNLHEAVSNQPAGKEDVGKVVAVLQRGYRRGESVIRPARVVVGIET